MKRTKKALPKPLSDALTDTRDVVIPKGDETRDDATLMYFKDQQKHSTARQQESARGTNYWAALHQVRRK